MDKSSSPKDAAAVDQHVDKPKAAGRPLALHAMATELLAQVQHRVPAGSLRSLFSCIGIGEQTPFNLPPQEQMLPRMKTNGHYFLTNYLLMSAGVFAFLLLFFHPIQLLMCFIVACGWYVVLTREHNSEKDHLVIYGRQIGEQEILLFTTATTVIFLLFFILPTIVFSISTSAVGSALHALLRNNRLKDDSYSYTSKVAIAEDQPSDEHV